MLGEMKFPLNKSMLVRLVRRYDHKSGNKLSSNILSFYRKAHHESKKLKDGELKVLIQLVS